MDQPALYRLPDAVFVAPLGVSIVVCLVHRARVITRRLGSGARRAGAGRERVRADARDGPASGRAFHWTNAATVGILVVSGLAIYGIPSADAARRTTAFWFAWHAWTAPLFAAVIVAHVVHEIVTPSHIDEMWPVAPRPGKYDAAQVVFHWLVALNLAALLLTGAVLWRPLRGLLPLRVLALGWDFVFVNRVLHAWFTSTLLALVLGHVYFGVVAGPRARRPRAGSNSAA